MFDGLFQAICRVGIFMICAQAIVHFRPNASYEAYLKLLVSVMIMIQLFLPVGSLLGGSGKNAGNQLAAFQSSLEEGMRLAEEQAAETDRILEQMTLEEVRRRMEEQERAEGQSGGQGAGGQISKENQETAAEGTGVQNVAIEIKPIAPVILEPAE